MSEQYVTKKEFEDFKNSFGKPKEEEKKLSSYQLFQKEKFAEVKTANPDMKPKEIIKKVAEMWNEQKKSNPIE